MRRYEQAGLAAENLQWAAAAVFAAAVACWPWMKLHEQEPLGWRSLVLMALFAVPVLLAAEIWIPRAITRLWAEPILYFSWPLWQALAAAMSPFVFGTRLVDTILHRLAGRLPELLDEDAFEEEIRSIVTEGHREGLLEEDAREMIESVIALGDVDVSQVMTPRTDMVSISASLPWAELLEFVTHASHTRVPVYQKNRDDIVGILYTKDLLPPLTKGLEEPAPSWANLLREPYFVPETKPVDALLQEFQLTRNHMAVVLDEYGGVSGLVTLEDVLEEIVGEIIDEYDKDLVDGIKQIDDQTAEVLGKVHLDEINERLGMELPEDADFDTIAGLVFAELGHVPVVGEEVVTHGVRVTVLEATRRRIERVRIDLDENGRGDSA